MGLGDDYYELVISKIRDKGDHCVCYQINRITGSWVYPDGQGDSFRATLEFEREMVKQFEMDQYKEAKEYFDYLNNRKVEI